MGFQIIIPYKNPRDGAGGFIGTSRPMSLLYRVGGGGGGGGCISFGPDWISALVSIATEMSH